MKIYSNIDLFNNSINNFITSNAVVGNSTITTDGAIKYDTTNHILMYYSTEQVNGTDKGWVAIGSSESTTINNNVNGNLKIKKGPGTSVSGNNFTATVAVNASDATNLMFDLDTGSGKNGNLIISNNNDSTDRVVINLLDLSNQYGEAIIPTFIKFGTFEITNSHTNLPINVTINHGLTTQFLDFSLYKKETVNNDSNIWSAIMCDYYLDSNNNLVLLLTGNSITDIRGEYRFIIVGNSNAQIIDSSTNITITQPS